VAAALIVVEHGFGHAGIPCPRLVYQGVSFFFVLSGFVLAYNYPKLHGPEIRRFLILRVGRIWPAHIVTAIAAAMIASTLDVKFIANAAMIHAWLPIYSWYFSWRFNHPFIEVRLRFTIIAIFGKFIFSLSSERVKETACLAADSLSAGFSQYVELETIKYEF
jgi:hypothetical protein